MKKINSWYLPDNEKHLVKYIKKQDGYQQDCRTHALSFVQNYRCAIDVGAHVGLWSRELTEKFERVIAFEPMPAHRECYRKNVNLDKVMLMPYALGDKESLVRMDTDPESTGHTFVGGAGETEQVTLNWCAMQDSFLYEYVDFIKLDCEGYEYFALKGAENVLLKHRPIINIEQKAFIQDLTALGIDDPFYLKHGQYAACKYLESIGAKFLSRFKDEFVYGW